MNQVATELKYVSIFTLNFLLCAVADDKRARDVINACINLEY